MLKHSEEIEKKEKVRFDLYKILRMSILLSQNDVDEETLKKFQDASSNIDEILDKDYEKKLETLFYKTNTLEEEEDRLKKLVTLVKNRVEQRKSLIDDYQTITFKRFPDLGYINFLVILSCSFFLSSIINCCLFLRSSSSFFSSINLLCLSS